MKPVKSFTVNAAVPESLNNLRFISNNLFWYWNLNAVKLFYRIDRKLWESTYHNPVKMLGVMPQERYDILEKDEGILAELERIKRGFDSYLNDPSWYSKKYPEKNELTIAYFSLEFGLAEAVPIYSGGLGILAGDHLKSASDLGLPLVGVGLLYQEGYFKQYLNNDGWQGESYADNDFYNMPVSPVLDSSGRELTIELEFPDGVVKAKIWQIQVGRIQLVLLDTNIEENQPAYRSITATLYGGDEEMRLKQEMLLGIGGLRALHAMDIWPTVFHMNEGHAAFLALENIRTTMEGNGVTFNEAFDLTSSGNVFTTHTPVPAGHDRFTPQLMLKYFESYFPELGLTEEEFLGLGRLDPKNSKETFCMTVLALKSADHSNAVSRLHMKVTWDMWKDLWPDFPIEEVPIQHVTNGIHVPSWISQDVVELFERYVGPRWRTEPTRTDIWTRIMDIPDEEIWRSHERRRERLVSFARKRLGLQLERRGVSDAELHQAQGVLDSKILTIGFARRFATYKRADLIFRDIERLARILTDSERPVQLIIAGKAHPRDTEGKNLIRRIVHFTRREDLRNRIVFIEDYDMCVARYMVQGVDVWLNNPRRPLEASGTSGMKATVNGALNLSVLDGWWDEAYTPEVGWAIGSGEVYDDQGYQDEVESNAIYDILEKEVVPKFYTTGSDHIPRQWTQMMKQSMSRLTPVFNTGRMVNQYFDEHYLPAHERFRLLKADNAKRARELSLWKQKVMQNWKAVKVKSVVSDETGPFEVGHVLAVTATLSLGKLSYEDVAVELYAGMVNSRGDLVEAAPIKMDFVENSGKDSVFKGEIPFGRSGRTGYSVRVLPSHPDLIGDHELRLISWA